MKMAPSEDAAKKTSVSNTYCHECEPGTSLAPARSVAADGPTGEGFDAGVVLDDDDTADAGKADRNAMLDPGESAALGCVPAVSGSSSIECEVDGLRISGRVSVGVSPSSPSEPWARRGVVRLLVGLGGAIALTAVTRSGARTVESIAMRSQCRRGCARALRVSAVAHNHGALARAASAHDLPRVR